MSRTGNRRRALATFSCGALLVAALPALAQQQDLSAIQIETVAVAPGIYMLVGAGGNIGVSVGEDGVLIIDDQYAPLAPKIIAALARLSPQPLRFVINTHWHGDHTGGNEVFGGAGAVIVAHGNVRQRMSVPQWSTFAAREVPASPAAALPVVTFTQDVRLHFNGDELHVFHVPDAHTDGDAFVHFKRADVLHLGDVLFTSSYPFIDGGSGGSLDGMISALDGALTLIGEKTRVIPGHGPLATRQDVLDYRNMLATVRARLKAAIAGGQTLEQVQAAGLTREFDARWGGGYFKPEVFVASMYKMISAQGAAP